MPNHVVNEIIFTGITPQQRDELLAVMLNAEGEVDFTVLLPPPLNIWNGGAGVIHEKTFPSTALDWARANWGTKWNAYSQLPVEVSEDRLRLVFETAWRPPYGWLVAVMNRCRVPFDHNWHDEGREYGRVGRFEFGTAGFNAGEPLWSERDAEGDMQRHLHKLQWDVEEFPAETESCTPLPFGLTQRGDVQQPSPVSLCRTAPQWRVPAHSRSLRPVRASAPWHR